MSLLIRIRLVEDFFTIGEENKSLFVKVIHIFVCIFVCACEKVCMWECALSMCICIAVIDYATLTLILTDRYTIYNLFPAKQLDMSKYMKLKGFNHDFYGDEKHQRMDLLCYPPNRSIKSQIDRAHQLLEINP